MLPAPRRPAARAPGAQRAVDFDQLCRGTGVDLRRALEMRA
jgi:hypothetical protein